jgi:hypothetical protein
VLEALLHIDIHAKSARGDTCQICKNPIHYLVLFNGLVPNSAAQRVFGAAGVETFWRPHKGQQL